MKETIEATLILFVRGDGDINAEVLLGKKNNGSVAGWVMAPGGHIEKSDKTPCDAARREGFEEVNLKSKSDVKVAELNISFRGGKKKVLVHVFKSTSWTGKLTKKDDGLDWVTFFYLRELPYHQLPTGEIDWLVAVLNRRQFCRVFIKCGANRQEVRSVKTVFFDDSPF